ncbi:efflux RND transporter periplasmic adaptor subunit [Chitinophaga parva]|uniref:Efflux RND transporter periplasmic adaptor subunit n=1 Tax=Chitinophaga parva TaxID=2169414 RepID=A0A2T7BBY6_9BACT|nr:efflux RND transporter periplasmic adaptor subunit [Chitinophaga parva]PUZ22607.1 efflux RND transporter periplasmic adaptor subunit [Chitinophaga parva]
MKRMLMLTGVVGLLCHTGCKPKQQEKEVETRLEVTSPLRKDTAINKEYVAQIRAIRHIELRAQEKGYLQKVFVDEGQYVKQGQLLFQIMPALYQAELQKAEAEVQLEDIELRNTQKLADSNVVAPNELAMARARLAKAQAEAALSKVHLQFTEVRAPFDGIVDRLMVKQGSLVNEDDLLTNLADNSRMWVYFNVPEAEYLDYKSKNNAAMPAVKLKMANKELFAYPGVVETIEGDFNNETGNIPFRATFPNPKGLLRHGETGDIEMEVPAKDALLIPQKATFEILDKKYVYVVGNDQRVHSREITIGASLEDLYVVTDGLEMQDKVLLEGLRKVKDNDKISYDFVDPAKVIGALKLPAE